MKGPKHPKNDITINPSNNPSIVEIIEGIDASRRRFIGTTGKASVAVGLAGVYSGSFMHTAQAAPLPASLGFGGMGFDSIPAKLAPVANSVEVPPGYKVEVLTTWGQPIMPGGKDWNPDVAQQGAAEQEKQFGMHNDGMHFFPFSTRRGPSSERGILCVNNEYTDEVQLHADGPQVAANPSTVSIAKTRKSQAGHGISILEVSKTANGGWGVVRNSVYGRRITANTPVRIAGPAAGHPLLKSKRFNITPTSSIDTGAFNDGFSGFGTINNCAHGYTPWGTYLTCEENWNGNFGWNAADPAASDPSTAKGQVRYGITATGFNYNWHLTDPRFNARTNPLEPHLFGWVVEIDPNDPKSVPVKRTAMGRFKHESAQTAISRDNNNNLRVAYYMGDDERNEYVYKFVAAGAYNPNNRAANRDLLDSGILYVARFTSTATSTAKTYRGEWLALVPDAVSVIANGNGGFYKLRELTQFGALADGVANSNDAEVQALILIKTRQAADALGATMMDRPEWAALRTYGNGWGYSTANGTGLGYSAQYPLEMFLTLTNNNRRGGGGSISVNSPNGTTAAGSARPPVDLANPRPDNDFGHIIRWREDGNMVTATGFEWDIFVLCGDTATAKTLASNYQNANLVDGVAGTGAFYQGNILDNPAGSADLGAPDGLWFDQFGRLWIQTDQQGDAGGDFNNIGANSMSCADPNTGEIRRFMTSPANCEVTGVVNTPDGKTMFVGIQHPGEDAPVSNPIQNSTWPQSQFSVNSAGEPLALVPDANNPGVKVAAPVGAPIRPRSSVLVITRIDGGVIGA